MTYSTSDSEKRVLTGTTTAPAINVPQKPRHHSSVLP